MKNQYLGDIGDYGKYGLLRYLRDQGIRIGVNWYLTPGDGKSDGIHTEYLDDMRMRCYDPELFDTLGGIVHKQNKDISLIEESGLLSGLRFYHTMMDFDSFPGGKEQPSAPIGINKQWMPSTQLILSLQIRIMAYPRGSDQP